MPDEIDLWLIGSDSSLTQGYLPWLWDPNPGVGSLRVRKKTFLRFAVGGFKPWVFGANMNYSNGS